MVKNRKIKMAIAFCPYCQGDLRFIEFLKDEHKKFICSICGKVWSIREEAENEEVVLERGASIFWQNGKKMNIPLARIIENVSHLWYFVTILKIKTIMRGIVIKKFVR